MRTTIGIALWACLFVAVTGAHAQENAADTTGPAVNPSAVATVDTTSAPVFKDEAAPVTEAPADTPSAETDFPEKSAFVRSRDTPPVGPTEIQGATRAWKWVVAFLFLFISIGGIIYLKRRGFMPPMVKGTGRYKITQSIPVAMKARIVVLEGPAERMVVGISGDRMVLLKNVDFHADAVDSEHFAAPEEFEAEMHTAESAPVPVPSAAPVPPPAHEASAPAPASPDSAMARQIEDKVKSLKRFFSN